MEDVKSGQKMKSTIHMAKQGGKVSRRPSKVTFKETKGDQNLKQRETFRRLIIVQMETFKYSDVIVLQ